MLKLLIVDDEAPAHDVLLHHIASHHDLELIGQCYNAAEALAALATMDVDLLLLDVRMPGFSGLDLLRGLPNPRLTIIVSAHRDHAVDGFTLDVIDYLLKPVSGERFSLALDKVRRRLEEDEKADASDIFLKVDRTMRRFALDDIAWCQAQGNFVRVWTGTTDSILATTTLSALESALPGGRFARVHKSHIVNCRRICELSNTSLTLDTGAIVPIGRSYRGTVELRR